MPKHHLRESFKSFFGSHVDPEKDEELKGTKTEIDGKVQEILKFLKEEDGNDRKEPLADLIEDIHNHYQSLYVRYDHLTEELRKKAHINNEKDSSSSSSDSSDSDDSPKKKGQKNGKLENNFENDTAVIKQELEIALLEVDYLKRKLTITTGEKEALYHEFQIALSKAEEAQRIMRVVNAEAETLNEEESRLFGENRDLKTEVDIANKLQAELNQKLKDMNTEMERLIVEKTNAEELRTVNGQLQREKDNLQLELEAAKGDLFTLKEKFESAENEITKLSQMRKATEEENTNLSSKIHGLIMESSQLREKVVERERELSSHLEMHEAHKEETTVRVKDLEIELDSSHTQRRELEKTVGEISELLIQIERLKEELANKSSELNKNLEEKETLQLELSSTNDLKVELDEQVKAKNDEISEYLIQIETLKAGFENKISEFENTIVGKGDEIFAIQKRLEDVQNEKSTQIADLTENINSLQQEVERLKSEKSQFEVQIERLKHEFNDSFSLVESQKTELLNQIIALERELKERDDALIKLHEEKNDEINQLEENIEDLKRDLEMKADEMSTVVDTMRTIEVKQRLASQKLRITEQFLGEKDEIHQSKVDKLKEEQKSLEERIAALLGVICTYKAAQVKIVTEISDKVNNTLTGIDLLNVKFEEDYGHLESRIYEIVNELKVAKNWISESNGEKDEMKKEIASLVQQLKDEKEQELQLMGKIWELEAELRKDEDIRKGLIGTVKVRDEKIGELEKMIEEMEKNTNQIQDQMSEEKREAIRQLCIWIDYHHKRYDDLKGVILKTRGRGRR